VEEGNRSRYFLAQERKMIEPVVTEKDTLQLLNELVTRTHAPASGHAGLTGANVGQMVWYTDKEDVKIPRQTYYPIKSKTVARAKAINRKVASFLWKETEKRR
jgi:hypothetical protein